MKVCYREGGEGIKDSLHAVLKGLGGIRVCRPTGPVHETPRTISASASTVIKRKGRVGAGRSAEVPHDRGQSAK